MWANVFNSARKSLGLTASLSFLMTVSSRQNGSRSTGNGQWLDILAISCDSFEPESLRKIGRGAPRKNHLSQLLKIRELCRRYFGARVPRDESEWSFMEWTCLV